MTTLQDRSRLAYMRYRGGVDTLLNALDADRDLFDAELAWRKPDATNCWRWFSSTGRWAVAGSKTQKIPSCSLAASDMRSRSQGGSQTTSTFTSVTPGTSAIFCFTCSGRDCAAGHAGAVSVMRMPTGTRRVDDDVVDQAELVDVDRNLGVEHLRERFDDRAA